eukprot:1351690-Prymnesium_polylepis.1
MHHIECALAKRKVRVHVERDRRIAVHTEVLVEWCELDGVRRLGSIEPLVMLPPPKALRESRRTAHTQVNFDCRAPTRSSAQRRADFWALPQRHTHIHTARHGTHAHTLTPRRGPKSCW